MIAIVGPTSSGKTSLALKISKELGYDIVSFDSRQIYKFLDIGTGKMPLDVNCTIEKHERHWKINGINIYMYDVALPNEDYSISRYLTDFYSLNLNLEKCIFVGGTGYYLDALINPPKTVNVPVNKSLRDELKDASLERVQSLLNPQTFSLLNISEKNNKQRLIRKLEIQEYDIPYPMTSKALIRPVIIGLNSNREYLYQRVDYWVDSIWNDLLAEIKLLDQMDFMNAKVLRGIIYNTAIDAYKSKLNSDEAKSKTKFELHKYIRKQITYFNNKLDNIRWFDISDPNYSIDIISLIKYHLIKA